MDKPRQQTLSLSVRKKGVDAMVISKYQSLAMRTSPEDGHDRVMNGCMGLIGESGEIVDLIKKWKFQSGKNAELPKEKLIEECGDVLWYCAELSTGLNADMGVIFSKTAHHFDDLHKINEAVPLEVTVTRLAAMAVSPSVYLFDGVLIGEREKINKHFLEARTKSDIVGIISVIKDILDLFCDASLEDAMEHNIEKLRKRYPDGFDPERSLHREE